MKRLILIINILFLNTVLHCQKLVLLQQTVTGSVVPLIQPTSYIDIYKPVFNIDYYDPRSYTCQDSIFIKSYAHDPLATDQKELWSQRLCADNYDLTSYYEYSHGKFLNTTDPLTDDYLNISPSGHHWYFDGERTWHYAFSQRQYACTNDNTGYMYANDQTWKLDEKKRLKKISILGDEEKTTFTQDYIYAANGKLKRLCKISHNSKLQATQTEWFFDDNQRNSMMITYDGKHHNFTEQQLNAIKALIDANIKDDKQILVVGPDSISLNVVIVYNYGKYGLEQANCFTKGYDNYYETKYISDSLFYDKKGRISRFKAGFRPFAYREETFYSYSERNGNLSEATTHHYSDRPYSDWFDFKSLQVFTYDPDGRISSLNEKNSVTRREYLEGHYQEPTESIMEEIYNTYRYGSTKRTGE